MYQTWAEMRKAATKRGLEKGQTKGAEKARKEALLTVLHARGIPVPDEARARILAERDPERVARWLARAAVARSLATVLEEKAERAVLTRRHGQQPARRAVRARARRR